MIQVENHPEIVAYLNAVCAEIRSAQVHAEIRQELLGHLVDQTEAGVKAGLSEAEAVTRALQQAGDPVMVGGQLNQTHRPRTEWRLLVATALLVALGIWAMYAVDASNASPAGIALLPKKLLWSALGVVGAGALMFLDYRKLQRLTLPLTGATILFVVWAGALGPYANGQSQWSSLGPLLFAPALAGIFARWNWQSPWAWSKALLLFLLPVAALLVGAGDFPVLEYVVLYGVMLAATRPSWRQVLPMAMSGVALGTAGLLKTVHTRHLVARLQAWLHPFWDPQGAGYQVAQSLQALREAGPWGRGLTASLQRVPEIHSEFVFPYLVYTLGWVAGAGICILVIYFVVRLARVARSIREPFGAMLVRAALTLFALEFGWNLLMTVGVVPTVGVAMPFVSHGGREVLYMAAIGLVLSVFRRKELIAAPPART